jgi:hypothetical protein
LVAAQVGPLAVELVEQMAFNITWLRNADRAALSGSGGIRTVAGASDDLVGLTTWSDTKAE